MTHISKSAKLRIVHARAVHEAAHAVLRWRGGEAIYGGAFIDTLAPFEEIIISPHVDYTGTGNIPPLKLADGRSVIPAAPSFDRPYRSSAR